MNHVLNTILNIGYVIGLTAVACFVFLICAGMVKITSEIYHWLWPGAKS